MERVALFVAVSLIGLIAIAGAVQSATVTREKRSSTTCASTKACLSPFPMLEEFVTEDNAKGLFAASYEVVLTELCSKKDQLSSCLDRAYCRDVEISYAGEAVKQTLEYICQEGKEKFISESKCFARDAFDFGFKMCAKAVESELTTLSALVQLRLQDSSVYCSRIDKFFTCLKTQVENACSEDAASVITTLTSKVYTPLAIQVGCVITL